MTLLAWGAMLYLLASALLLGPALYLGITRHDDSNAVILVMIWLALTLTLVIIMFIAPNTESWVA